MPLKNINSFDKHFIFIARIKFFLFINSKSIEKSREGCHTQNKTKKSEVNKKLY